MAHFAKLTPDNRVIEVVVADEEFIAQGHLGAPSEFVQCSYNTWAGQHYLGGTPLRANFPGPGWHYDPQLDIFYPPHPGGTARLNTQTGQWERPRPRPNDGQYFYVWNEQQQDWEPVL